MFPYGSYLGGEFSEFKDPGHFVGKGFMKLDFDRLYIGDTVVPVDAKVVDVPGYAIDNQGRILGKGHAVRDTIMWMIPVLWPIDLLELPRRGPRPSLKAETAITLRVMEDVKVPEVSEPQRDPYGLVPRGSQSYAPDPPAPVQQDPPAPQMSYDPQPYSQPYAEPVQQPMLPAPVVAYAMPVAVPYMVVAPPFMVGYGGMLISPQVVTYAYSPPVYPARPYYYGLRLAPQAYSNRYGYAARTSYSTPYAARARYAGPLYRR